MSIFRVRLGKLSTHFKFMTLTERLAIDKNIYHHIMQEIWGMDINIKQRFDPKPVYAPMVDDWEQNINDNDRTINAILAKFFLKLIRSGRFHQFELRYEFLRGIQKTHFLYLSIYIVTGEYPIFKEGPQLGENFDKSMEKVSSSLQAIQILQL